MAGYARSRANPDTVTTARLAQRIGMYRRMRESGIPGATPRMRRSVATWTPATNAIPTEWKTKLEKNAGPDSRIQVDEPGFLEPDQESIISRCPRQRRYRDNSFFLTGRRC